MWRLLFARWWPVVTIIEYNGDEEVWRFARKTHTTGGWIARRPYRNGHWVLLPDGSAPLSKYKNLVGQWALQKGNMQWIVKRPCAH
jgi:hypothetical protein